MENLENLNFKGGNPGAVQHGNFINYYQFHPPENRIKMLSSNLLNDLKDKKIVALDIGCNAGDLTNELYKYISETISPDCHILGIDIDPVLIKRAEEQKPNQNIHYKCLNIMEDNTKQVLKTFLSQYNLEKFNVVFCFSVTMWIHLNNGDDGLKNFLKNICELSEYLILEPQPWKCYKTAVKRMKQSNETFPLFKTLKMNCNIERDIQTFLIENCNCTKLGESGKTEWGRSLLYFK